MHTLFTDWYSTVDPAAQREVIQKRWDATAELVESMTIDRVVSLAAYITRDHLEAPEWLRNTHKSHDDVMPTRGIAAELRVLAGAALRVCFDNVPGSSSPAEVDDESAGDANLSTAAALALLCGAFGLQNEPSWLSEHLRAGAKYIAVTASQIRQTATPLKVSTPLSVDALNSVLASVQDRLNYSDESRDYLWWALSRYSRLLSDRYSNMSPAIAAIAIPSDAFSFARAIPAAPESETLILNTLLDLEGAAEMELSFKNFAVGLGKEKAAKLTPRQPVCRDLCPVLWAAGAVAAGKTWIKDFEQLFGFRTSTAVSAQAIAIQCFRELSLSLVCAQKGEE